MVGSTASIADPNTVLNTIVAETLRQAADVLEASDDPIMAAHDLTKQWISEHIRIIFNGNGYSEEWVEEAERRGLPNIKNMVDALGCLTEEYAVELFERHKVMTRVELTSRQEVGYEAYAKAINIEARTMIDMTKKEIIPAVIKYTTTVAQSVAAVKAVGADASVQEASLAEISKNLVAMNAALEKLEAVTDKAAAIEDPKAQAIAYRDEVFTTMSVLREPADALEMLVDKSVWPFPTYGDLLFNV